MSGAAAERASLAPTTANCNSNQPNSMDLRLRPAIKVIGRDAALTIAVTQAIGERARKSARRRAFLRVLREFFLKPIFGFRNRKLSRGISG